MTQCIGPRAAANISLHTCVGVVCAPSRGMMQGEATWSCRLLLSQIGTSAHQSERIVSQESLNVRCRGAHLVAHCVDNLKEGSIVHVVSKLIQRPKYVPIHAMYVDETDLLITDSFGMIRKIANLQ